MREPPTHLVTDPSSSHTICGIKLNTKAALPYVWALHAKRHADHGVQICSLCSPQPPQAPAAAGGPEAAEGTDTAEG